MKFKWNFFGLEGLGGTDNFNAYRVVNEEFTELCEKLKPESFKQYCYTWNCHSSLREMYDMARRYRGVQRRRHVGDFSWLPEFAEKMASPFVSPKLSFPGRRTSKLNGLCKNSYPGMGLHILGACPSLGWSFCWGYITTVWTRRRLRWTGSVHELLRS
jgi:hypothetical protein